MEERKQKSLQVDTAHDGKSNNNGTAQTACSTPSPNGVLRSINDIRSPGQRHVMLLGSRRNAQGSFQIANSC